MRINAWALIFRFGTNSVKQSRSHRQTVHLPARHLCRVRKVPLAGFLVNGEEAPASEIMVANGLDVTKENLLALRYVQFRD